MGERKNERLEKCESFRKREKEKEKLGEIDWGGDIEIEGCEERVMAERHW